MANKDEHIKAIGRNQCWKVFEHYNATGHTKTTIIICFICCPRARGIQRVT